MMTHMNRLVMAAILAAAPAFAQNPPRAAAPGPQAGPGQAAAQPAAATNPFPAPIPATEGAVTVGLAEFAVLPDVGEQPPRMNLLLDQASTHRIFVNTMQGTLYSISYDGKSVKPYLDLNDPKWGHPVQSGGSERGFHSFAFHPQFAQAGSPGFGRLYTYADTSDIAPAPDFVPLGAGRTHDMILLEWTVKDPNAAAYDGEAPRELFRIAHPFPNHNGGEIAFNPLARPGSPEFGLLYLGSADGGSGGDPYNHSQNLESIFGKILRIDPLGRNSTNGKYGIPASNPFAKNSDALGEIYSYGHRNPQRFSWDPKNGKMFEAEIGQNINEEVNLITAGGNYGWNLWEGSFKYSERQISLEGQRADPKVTYPIVEFDHTDPLFTTRSVAATGVYVYREKAVKPLTGMLIFGDNPSGEVFFLNADALPGGGQNFQRVVFKDGGETRNLLQIIKNKNTQQGKTVATRADLRMGVGPNGQLFLLNKHDGTIRLVVPGA